MKRIIAIVIVFAAAVGIVSAQSLREDREIKTLNEEALEGRVKAGVLLGMPSGATIGYRFSNWFETNLTVGYSFIHKNSAVVRANSLFTVLEIPMGDAGMMPFSLGPQVSFFFGDKFVVQLVGDLRLEYTFEEIPLNLFVEGGFGFQFNDDDWIAWNSGIGVRYVF